MAYDAADITDNDNLATALSAQIQISTGLIGTVRNLSVEPLVLAKRWGITPEKALKTIQATTQRGIGTMLYPLLSKRYRMNDRNFHYYCMAHPLFSDTMFANTMFRNSNRCVQEYATDFGWARAFPMASKSEAHETLLWLFVWDGVLPTFIYNNAK